MHSRIFEIKDAYFERDEWASDYDIADDNLHIEGVDYFQPLGDEGLRCEDIKDFFTNVFPDNSFKILSNRPDETAIVRFVGDIKALYEKWIASIKEAANNIDYEEKGWLSIYDVALAVNDPFDIDHKFYQPDWNGCTVGADDFLGYLRHLSEKNEGRPFKIYVGQVFDFHF